MDAALKTMLTGWIDACEPREPNRRQRTLTERFLKPHLEAVERFFLALRAETDADVAAGRRDWTGAKAYPEGYCREIRNDVLARLRREMSRAGATRRHPVAEFIRAGGLVKPLWGDLRGVYLQNAIQLGSLYVDAANDTVDVTKPKVEILPLTESGMRPLRTPGHFAAVVAHYWNAPVYTNTLIPALFPIFPLLVWTDNELRLAPTQRPLMAHAILGGFRPAEDYWDGLRDGGDRMPDWMTEAALAALRRQGLDPELGVARAGPADHRQIADAFAAFRSPAGPARDSYAFSRFAALARPVERLALPPGPAAVLSPESGEIL